MREGEESMEVIEMPVPYVMIMTSGRRICLLCETPSKTVPNDNDQLNHLDGTLERDRLGRV